MTVNKLLETAQNLQLFFESRGWQFCFIGGIALLHWGEPRLTQDVDVTLLTGFGDEERFVRTLLNEYEPRISDAYDFAMTHRVVLLKTSAQTLIDVTLAGLPNEEDMIARSRCERYSDTISLRLCSAEDLIVHKVFAGRNKDWGDVESILLKQEKLDWQLIELTLLPLLEMKDDVNSFQKLIDLRTTSQSNG